MFGSHDSQGLGARIATNASRATPVIETIALTAAFLACAIGFSLVLSQPLAAVANADAFEPVALVSLHW